MSNTNTSSSGIGFTGLLTIVFIGQKLTGNIDWSRGWVLSPLWILAILAIGILILVVLGLIINECVKDNKR